jgi:hypothetical protein
MPSEPIASLQSIGSSGAARTLATLPRAANQNQFRGNVVFCVCNKHGDDQQKALLLPAQARRQAELPTASWQSNASWIRRPPYHPRRNTSLEHKLASTDVQLRWCRDAGNYTRALTRTNHSFSAAKLLSQPDRAWRRSSTGIRRTAQRRHRSGTRIERVHRNIIRPSTQEPGIVAVTHEQELS